MPITIYTIAGTGSVDPTIGFQAHIGKILAAEDPVTWQWYPVDFHPGFKAGQDIPLNSDDTFNFSADAATLKGSATRAFRIVRDHILSNPNYFVFTGQSQGSWIADMLYEELRNPAGVLHSKYPYFLTACNFGSPRRPHGHTLTSACLAASGFTTGQIIDPAGQGACGTGVYPTSFGTVPGIMASPPTNGEIQWFCNQDDAASDSHAYYNSNVQDVIATIARWAWHSGDTGSTLVSVGKQFLDLVPHMTVNELKSAVQVLQQWWPFAGGIVDNIPVANLLIPEMPNPHQLYDVMPGGVEKDVGPYTSISGCTLTGVELAVNYLRTLGARYATGPATPVPKSSYSWWQNPD